MSKLHVLAGSPSGYQLIIHTSTPVGVNAVANSWKAVLLAAGIAQTSHMVVGTALGQVTSSEAALILSGDTLEFSANYGTPADGSTPTSTALNTFIDAYIASELSRLQVVLKFYGYTQ